MCMGDMSVMVYSPEDNLEEEMVLSLYHVGPRNWTQVISLGGRCLTK